MFYLFLVAPSEEGTKKAGLSKWDFFFVVFFYDLSGLGELANL